MRGPAAAAYHVSTKTTRVSARKAAARSAKAAAARKRTTRASRLRRVARFWNPLLPGSHESLLRQNAEIDDEGLPRIQDDAQLEQLIEKEELVALPETAAVRVNPALKDDRKMARPVVVDFLNDLGKAYYDKFGQAITVTSAVRTAEQQRKLRRRNGNAAPETGETASSHLSGLTVDLGKRGLTRAQHAWLENYLKVLKDEKVIEPAEERRQACFHVMIYERYQDWRQRQVETAIANPGE